MINENLHDLYQVKSKREISSTYRRSASRWQKKDKADFITNVGVKTVRRQGKLTVEVFAERPNVKIALKVLPDKHFTTP
ncbi:MAG: hypothetical protein GPJ18_00485 [Microcystis aeruginosa F13-15]|nr:hypothetical protein [Microcystis aeruginosa F13-15]